MDSTPGALGRSQRCGEVLPPYQGPGEVAFDLEQSIDVGSRMPGPVIQLPTQKEQTSFNLRRWSEVCLDPQWQQWPGRVETDHHGNIIVSPPPSFNHGRHSLVIARLLEELLEDGESSTECPISTPGGVKGPDAVWISNKRLKSMRKDGYCFAQAPEICVEVISPRNRKRDMAEKKTLYFAAGAEEVWFCSQKGKMTFFLGPDSPGAQRSEFCPQFPLTVKFGRK